MSVSSNFEAELCKLDKYLSDKSYVEDFSPTTADVKVLAKLELLQIRDADFPHLARWRKHLLSYEESERKKFPQSNTDPQAYLKRIGIDGVTFAGKAEVRIELSLPIYRN